MGLKCLTLLDSSPYAATAETFMSSTVQVIQAASLEVVTNQ